MPFAQREYQQAYYDRTYPRRAEAVREQLCHPMFRSFNDRLAGRVLDLAAQFGGIGDVYANANVDAKPSTNGHGPAPLRVFEPACGEGFLGESLQRVARERGIALRYSGGDLSQAAIDLARPHLGDDLVAGDAAEVTGSLEPGSVDVVVLKNILHHLADPAEVLRAAGRAVGSTGVVAIVEARMGCPHFMVLGALAPKREKFYFCGTRRNRAAVDSAGLTLRDEKRFSFLPYELFFQSRFRVMRRVFSTTNPAVIRRYTRLDDGLARALPWVASYWVWAAAPCDA